MEEQGGTSQRQSEENRGTNNRNRNRRRKRNKKIRKGEINIRLLNVNGISSPKYTQLEELFFGEGKGLNMLCLTEVKGRYDRIKKGEGLEHFNTFRSGGKKGGGYR